MRKTSLLNSIRSVALGAAAVAMVSQVAQATPYATCLTNTGTSVSFRLNDAADRVVITWNGGASSTNLGARPKGLTVTNIVVGTPYFISVAKTNGNNLIQTNGAVQFNSARALCVNNNTFSTNFGSVFVGNGAAVGARIKGVYVMANDLTILNSGGGGIDYSLGGASIPQRMTIGEDDDLLYVADWSDASGNLWVTDQGLVGPASYAIQRLGPCLNGLTNAATDTGNPVGYGNTHGSVEAVAVWGTQANSNLTIITCDEDLQDDRAQTTANQMNSWWRYDVGTNAFPYQEFWTNRLLTPNVQFVSNVEGLSHGPGGSNGWMYCSQSRSAGNEPGVFVLTNVYSATGYAWNNVNVWNSKTKSAEMGSATDILKSAVAVSASRDGRFLAVFNSDNNVLSVVRLTNGFPDLSRIYQTNLPNATGAGREIAWDRAMNLYVVTTSAAVGGTNLSYINLNLTGTNITGSDGTFTSQLPSFVEVTATVPVAHRTDINGQFTFYRDGDISAPLTVRYITGGAATNGVDYSLVTSNITFAAGESSTNLVIVPLASSGPISPRVASVTLVSSNAYNLTAARTANLVIADNSTPQVTLARNFVSAYERMSSDFIRFTITRLGETNIAVVLNMTNAGTATVGTFGSDLNTAAWPNITLSAGTITTVVEMNPGANSGANSNLFATIGIDGDGNGGTIYTLGSNTVGNFTVYDSDQWVKPGSPPETVLWSYDFGAAPPGNTNTLPADGNWTFLYGTTNGAPSDYTYEFGHDYSVEGIPFAPGGFTTTGLKATVNKNDALPQAAALNFFPTNVFTGNYALRFSMFIMAGGINNTEHALFGLNHSGTKTNWNRNGGIFPAGTAANQDGIWASVNATGANSWDYALFTAGTNGGTGPTVLTNRASTVGMDQVFKSKSVTVGPYSLSATPGIVTNATSARNWTDVEYAQSGNMIQLRMNGQVISSITNVTGFNSGKVMLGYADMFDSIGDINKALSQTFNAAVYYDNVRVVSIAVPTILTDPVGFTAPLGTVTNLSVIASTTTGVTNYQWYRNGVAVAGATGSTLSFPSLASTNYGAYYVVVNDGTYPVSSAVAVVVPPPPSIITPPSSRAAGPGGTTTFSVVASTFSGTTNYQWKLGTTNVSTSNSTGSTAASVTISNLAYPVNFGAYTVVVSDGFNSVTSSPAANLTLAVGQSITPALVTGGFKLSFNSEVGPKYIVEFTTNVSPAAWFPLSTNNGTGSTIDVTNASAASTRFYRVRIQ